MPMLSVQSFKAQFFAALSFTVLSFTALSCVARFFTTCLLMLVNRPLATLAQLAIVLSLIAGTQAAADTPVQRAEGLWEYTGLVTRDGTSLPLTGVFLISKDTFVQQSIFNDEPFETAGSMAHAGPYWGGGAGLRLTSEQTLSLDPTADAPLQSAGTMEHDLKVERVGDELTLTFGGGTSTVQTFRKLGDAEDTELLALEDGTLALADGWFILVAGNSDQVISGYGRYDRAGSKLSLKVERWAESDGRSVVNLRHVTRSATLTDDALVLDDGRRMAIAP
jgi:hypothetical protein